MFNVGIWEIVLTLLVALLILGPEQLPVLAKTLGRFVGTLKKTVNGFRTESMYNPSQQQAIYQAKQCQ